MTTLAIDIGGTKLAAALIDREMNILDRREMATPASKTQDALQGCLAGLVAPLTTRAQRVAIASTGIIQNGVLSAINPENLGGLAHFPLVEVMARLTALPCIAVNDAQAAAWAEYRSLAAEVSDMVFITVSTGVGGGIVSDGKLLVGTGGLAGHIGHTLADPNGPRCGCGRIGCVEAIASGRGIAAAAKGELAGSDAKTIFARATQGHPQANALKQRSAQTLARLIADIKASTDCQCVVIGGSVGLSEGYIELVSTFLGEEPKTYRTQLLAARHQHNAGLFGAALLAQEAMP
ncbi:N-acetylmannosamine kinase [Enterobacteriaceae bacterium H18W14]|uniref:N-acetylmannosamine kinase n=1 Tax=Dryocola boscaweniae TaxID=2925397 RepID=UPI0022F06802|nr:N-acetylmannosamine kinase [Dryocola boscaweniae]MCT4714707.1 N-acetylmannosamine kinase [Dryocola boscaweniae]